MDNLKNNITKRGRIYEANIEKKYLEKIQTGYLNFIKSQQNMRILIIDTNSIDFVNNVDDYKKITQIIMEEEYKVGVTTISL